MRTSRLPRAAQGRRVHDDDRGKADRHRRRGHDAPGHDLQRLDPWPADGRARRRLCRADAGQPRDQRDAAQHRLPRRDRRARRRRADAGQSRRAGDAALQGDAHRHLRLSLRARRADDPLARRVGHERDRHGAAARRAEGRQGQAAALRPGLSTSARTTSTFRATRRATSRPTSRSATATPTRSR